MSCSITSPSRTPASKPALDDIEFLIGNHDIEFDVGASFDEAGQQGAGQETLGDRGDGDPQEAARTRLHFPDRLHRILDLADRWPNRLEEDFAGFGQADAARCALDQGDADPILQALQGLADGGAGDAEPLAGEPEVARFRHRKKD
ncbi:hypothetical protein ACVITL_000242 [Rhizobium pisi]